MASNARKLLGQALEEELTLEKARQIVRDGLSAMKTARVSCPNCGKNVPMGLTEDWEKRARFIQVIADQGYGKPEAAQPVDPVNDLRELAASMSDEELSQWLKGQ